ncbi:MAG: DUF362 domain-containing protein [Acidobacteria bacterium]|nr:DUF362 domain-containing protein [Acidobacteriota bacterium]
MALRRREFLCRTGLASLAALAAGAWPRFARGEFAFPKVAHVHHGRAAKWPRTTGLYRDHVDQSLVTRMLDEAVRALKGGTADQAWQRVFALGSNATRTLAIKVNCNNSNDPTDGAGAEIDALPEPVIAVIRGFLRAGGTAARCHVYDLTSSTGGDHRHVATWFRNRVLAACPGVQFRDEAVNKGGTYNARTHVTWSAGYAAKPPVTRIFDLVRQADYLVNVPIVKRHIGAGSTLGYKNHFGSIENCGYLHDYVFNDTANASVMADILGSPYVPGDPTVRTLAQKTVLTVGDMLYGQPCKNFDLVPEPWKTFGNEWPNSLVVSSDPVAADSVMIDLLEAEPAATGCGVIPTWGRRHLTFAQARGQGVHDHIVLSPGERFDPAHMAYTKIDYQYLDLWPGGADLRVSRTADGRAKLDWQHYFGGRFDILRAARADFSDAVVVGTTYANSWTDSSPAAPWFYRVDFAG